MRRLVFGTSVICVGALAVVVGTASGGRGRILVAHDAAQGSLRPPTLVTHVTVRGQSRRVTRRLPFISAGTLNSAADRTAGPLAPARIAPRAAAGSPVPGLSQGTLGCRGRTSFGSARVNQD